MAYEILGADGKPVEKDGIITMGSDQQGDLEIKALMLDPENRIVEVPTSSDKQDRDGDIVNQKGIDHQFANNVLYSHNYGYGSQLPIGTILSHRVQRFQGYNRTIEKHQFNPEGDYELSDSAWKLIEFGSLNRTSIGFIPKSIVRPETDEDREELGLGSYGVYFKAVEKLETSWVPVQSNREAIREAFGKGVINRTDTANLFPLNWDEINKPDHWAVAVDLGKKDVKDVDEIALLESELDAKIEGGETATDKISDGEALIDDQAPNIAHLVLLEQEIEKNTDENGLVAITADLLKLIIDDMKASRKRIETLTGAIDDKELTILTETMEDLQAEVLSLKHKSEPEEVDGDLIEQSLAQINNPKQEEVDPEKLQDRLNESLLAKLSEVVHGSIKRIRGEIDESELKFKPRR